MKPTSNQNARVGKVMKPSHFKMFNLNSMINRIDHSNHSIISGLKTK
ncbi:hypothetical protein J2Z57_001174 [Formosa algae]|uniref:Uncharacterized protein n=1 Tax=Formosa algae TaxID=225843 RepID=A0A9X0YIM8_9FLAO|nr:hypothetical protein [Formosa algae]MDQ0334741.1 hypothetical protein [Formosa algae]